MRYGAMIGSSIVIKLENIDSKQNSVIEGKVEA